METPETSKPVAPKRRRKADSRYGAHIEDLAPWEREQVLDQMAQNYSRNEEDNIASCDERMLHEDLRMRADGSPSARRPAATLPQSYWAVIEDLPDGGDTESTANKLLWYRAHLQMWAAKGIYKGSTDLTYTNREEDETDETREVALEGGGRGTLRRGLLRHPEPGAGEDGR